MKKKVLIILSVSAFLLLSALAVVVEQYYRLEVCNFVSKDGKGHGYYLYSDVGVDSLLSLLKEDYRVGSESAFRLHARYMVFRHPKSGYYHFPSAVGDKHLIRRLQLGEQTPVRLTFTKQVRTRSQLAGVLGKQLMLDSIDIKIRLDSTAYISRYGLTPETSLTLFIPDTYEVYWTLSADQLFDRMYKEYNRFWTEARCLQAQEIGLRPTEVMTLASIVESETNKSSEYPFIASIYLNRLYRGMALQACPTVIYAVGDFSMHRVLKRHLEIDSPYNTYKNVGLPPGPIRLASPVGIDAVLHAPKTDYLYMCANPDFSGTHIFSSSYSQHAATARKYQAALNARKVLE